MLKNSVNGKPNLKSPIFGPPHPRESLQIAWNCLQLGLAVLPASPFLAAACILWMMVEVWRREWRAVIRRPLNRGFAILGVLLTVNAGFSLNPGEAFLGLFNFLPFFAIFSCVGVLIQNPAQLRRMAWILVFGSLPVAIIGLGQLFWGWTGPIKLWAIVDIPLEATGTPPGRMASVFAYANVLASYLVITLTIASGLWIEEIQKKSGWRWFLSGAVVGNAIALIFTHSRNAWAVAVLVFLAFACYRGWRWLVTGAVAAAGTVLWSAFGLDPLRQWLRAIVPGYFWKRLTDELYGDRPLAQLRSTQWQFAWDLTLQRPWTGWGLRNFTPIYEQAMNYWLGHPHNLILMLMAETGIVATLLFCALVGWVLAKGVLLLQNWHGQLEDRSIFFTYLVAFAGCTLFHGLDVTLFDSRINFLGWLLLGSIVGTIEGRMGDSAAHAHRER